MSKKTALITGASSGIGKEFALIHAKRGGDLVIVARREEALLALKEELETAYTMSVTVIAQDLSEMHAAQTVYDAVKEQGIEIDYLINNAGFGGQGLFHKRTMETEHAMMQLNMVALTELTRLFLPDFVKRGSGKVLNVSSVASLMPGPLQAVYFATKAYVTSLSNALWEELRGTGVTVTALLPGATSTHFAAMSGMDKTNLFDKSASATSVAKAGYEAMLQGKMTVFGGLNLAQKIMMWSIPYTPKKLLLRYIRKMQTRVSS